MWHAYGNANVKPDGNANPYANINADSDSYGSLYSYTYSDGYSGHTVTDTDLRPGRMAIGTISASGPLCLPRRPWHGQHALRCRRPDGRCHADLVRPGLAL